MKKLVSVLIALVLILCSCSLSSFAAGAGDGNVTITVNLRLLDDDNPEMPFAYLKYYTDSKNHDPAYIQGETAPEDSVQSASASTGSGSHVTFLQPYYDFYSAVRVEMSDGSYKTIGASPLHGYVFDHWEGWETEAEALDAALKMPDRNEFTAKRDVELTAVFR